MINKFSLAREKRKGAREKKKKDKARAKEVWKRLSARLKDAAYEGADYLFAFANDVDGIIEKKLKRRHFLIIPVPETGTVYRDCSVVAISWGNKTEEQLCQIYRSRGGNYAG